MIEITPRRRLVRDYIREFMIDSIPMVMVKISREEFPNCWTEKEISLNKEESI